MALSFSCTASLPPQEQRKTLPKDHGSHHHGSRRAIQTIIQTSVIPSISSSPPQESLRRGNWVKLICGASFEDVVDIRNLSLIYTLAGVDCIDCAADASVINAVNEGIDAAREIVPLLRPWVMISVNDDEDVHFRKAEFDPEDCPPDCSRPCERVCPADAISLERIVVGEVSASARGKFQGVVTERCYGCGRCIPVCPYDKISAITYVRDATSTSQLLERNDVDAVEIHTSARHIDSFNELWTGLAQSISYVKLVAVSLPDVGNSTVSSMNLMYSIMRPYLHCYNLWQLDGRPMSGDIGRGATREAIAFAVHLAASTDRPPGFLQLAGGTNGHTIDYLKNMGLFQKMTIPAVQNTWLMIRPFGLYALVESSKAELCAAESFGSPHSLIGGVAYGGYARKIVGRILSKVPSQNGIAHIEDYPEYLLEALREAINLVGPVKGYNSPSHLP